MSLISRLPSGGGLSSTKVLTNFDLKTISNFGDIIQQTKMSDSDHPYGGIYYEDNGAGSGKLFVQCLDSNNYTQVYVYSIVNNVATKLKKIQVGNLSGSKTFDLSSDKNSNIVVLSDTSDIMSTIYYINKSNYAVNSFNAPMYDGSMLSFRGATVVNGVIYVTTYGNLAAPYLYKYNESGTVISNFTNNIGVLYGNGAVQFDAEGNMYIPFEGNSSNTGSYIMVSVTSDGTLRWRKSMSDLGVACGARLLNVKPDGTSLWYLSNSPYSLLTLDKDGNLLTKADNAFKSVMFYLNRVQLDDSDKFFYLQDVGGSYYYLKDSELNTMSELELTVTKGRPCVWFASDKLIVARFDGSFYIEVRKPYDEYMKR